MFDLLMSAGWPIWPLLALSIYALALILERMWYLRPDKLAPADVINSLLEQCQHALPTRQQTQQAELSCLAGALLAKGIERMRSQPNLSEHALRQSMELDGRAAVARIERHLSAIATVASVATLMGLLGTVIGMIDIFAAQHQQGQQPAQMAQGISIALYNTALGLCVAIPSLLAWRWLRTRADQMILTLELHAEQLIQRLQHMQRGR